MNYVLFFPDELRAETLSVYGNTKIRTPNYERLAAEGVTFEQCHAQNSVCSPSRCSLFTGQYVHTSGHRSLWNLLKPWEHNLFRYLKEAGYETRSYGKNDLFSKEAAAISAGVFTHIGGYGHAETPAPVHPLGANSCNDFLFHPMKGDYREHNDYRNLKAGMDFIKSRKKGDKPFILFLPLVFPHCPYTAPEPYYNMYSEDGIMPLRPEGTGKPAFHALIRKYRRLEQSNLKKIQAVYMGMTSFTDRLLGELMDCVEEAGIKDETMLISAADHGDYAGDYGLVEKWPSGCEDVLTRVPLLISAPGCKAGRRVKEQTELFDIMATILDDAGIQARHTMYARSLLPQIRGADGDPDRPVFCEGGYNLNEPHCNEGQLRESTVWMSKPDNVYYPKSVQQREHPESVGRASMIRTLKRKLILRTYGDSELYDLENDPEELRSVYGEKEYRQDQAELENRMLNWYIATSDAVPVEEDARA
ncbi:MAG: sulfatase-like hydrolase/transferase [Treponema sp.]|jgi:choline-sulfatase|nr:sulfatase-like hydrolase/transferase [Treponema sp.]